MSLETMTVPWPFSGTTLLWFLACALMVAYYYANDSRSRANVEGLKKAGRLPPGPQGLPILGSLLSFLAIGGNSRGDGRSNFRPTWLDWICVWRWRRLPVAKVFANWASEFGPVFSADVCGRRFVVVNDYDTIHEALTDPHGQFNYRPRDRQFYILGKRGLLAAEGRKHQRNRRFAMRAFRDCGVGKAPVTDIIRVECSELTDYLQGAGGRPIDARFFIAKAVFNVTSSFTTGRRFGWDDHELLDLAACADSATNLEAAGLYNFVFIPLVPFLYGLQPLGALKDLLKIFSFARAAIKCRRIALSAAGSEPRNVIDFYLVAEAGNLNMKGTNLDLSSSPHPLDYGGELLPSLRDIFIAGLETTTTALRWTFLLLAVHSDVQTRVRRELDRFSAGCRRLRRNEEHEEGLLQSDGDCLLPRYDEREHLPYTEATILEVLRWSSGVPVLPHATLAASSEKLSYGPSLGGFHIPPGTPVYLNVYAAHRDKKLWPNSPDLYAFDPRHFWDPERNVVVNRDKVLSFAMGKRSCIGEGLAKQELFCFVTSVVKNFLIRLPVGADPPDMCGKYGMTWAPLDHELCFIPRTDAPGTASRASDIVLPNTCSPSVSHSRIPP